MSSSVSSFYVILLGIVGVYLIMMSLQWISCLNYCAWPVCPSSMENDILDGNKKYLKTAYIVERQLQIVKNEMENYFCTNNKSFRATKLEDLLVEEGGQPIRSVIISSWLSGNDYLGNILKAHSSNFYIDKPFSHLTEKLYKNSSQTIEALDTLDFMFRCDYSNLTEYMNSTERRSQMLKNNIYLKEQCQLHKNYCWDSRFLSQLCRQFPFQTINLNQFILKLMERFLKHNTLSIKVVLLIRDPREVMLLRKRYDKCSGDTHCLDESILCYDMVEDYRAAVKFSKEYYDSFRIIRYEDLMLEPYTETKKLLKFYGMNFYEYIRNYLDFITNLKSKETRFRWRRELLFKEVEVIQKNCKLAMQLWGYVPVLNPYLQPNIHPIMSYVLDDTYE